MPKTYLILLTPVLSVAFLHSLAPDHWMPFAMIARAQNWSRLKLCWVVFFSGLAHVGSSVLFGYLGILAGFTLVRLNNLEASRAAISIWLLIGFGIAYMVWGLKKAREQKYEDLDKKFSHSKLVTIWTLFAIFVLGPCEPYIPLMFVAWQYGLQATIYMSIIFAAVTIFMMLTQSLLAYSGIQIIKHKIAEKYSHAIAGFVIVLTGLLVWMLGL